MFQKSDMSLFLNYRLLPGLEDDHAVSLHPYNFHEAVRSWDRATGRSYSVEGMIKEQSLFMRASRAWDDALMVLKILDM